MTTDELTLHWTPRWGQVGLSGAVHLTLMSTAACVPGNWGWCLVAGVLVSGVIEAQRLARVLGRRQRLNFRPTLGAMVLSVSAGSQSQTHNLGPFFWLYPGIVVVRARLGRMSRRWLWLFASELGPGEAAQLRRYLTRRSG